MFVAHLTAQGIVMKRAFLLLTLALVAQPQIADLTLSGYADADLRDACLASGFAAYLVKPGDAHELHRLLGGDPTNTAASKH